MSLENSHFSLPRKRYVWDRTHERSIFHVLESSSGGESERIGLGVATAISGFCTSLLVIQSVQPDRIIRDTIDNIIRDFFIKKIGYW